jgi:hypothetical protein
MALPFQGVWDASEGATVELLVVRKKWGHGHMEWKGLSNFPEVKMVFPKAMTHETGKIIAFDIVNCDKC